MVLIFFMLQTARSHLGGAGSDYRVGRNHQRSDRFSATHLNDLKSQFPR